MQWEILLGKHDAGGNDTDSCMVDVGGSLRGLPGAEPLMDFRGTCLLAAGRIKWLGDALWWRRVLLL